MDISNDVVRERVWCSYRAVHCVKLQANMDDGVLALRGIDYLQQGTVSFLGN